MSTLFIILDAKTNGYIDGFLDFFSFLAIFFSIYVITNKNPVVSVLFLIGLFVSIAINLILLGYNFIGLSYLLVYVGAVSILFLFILMLINIRISELLNDTNNSIALAIFTCVFFGFPIYRILNIIYTIQEKYKDLDLSLWLKSDTVSEDSLNKHNDEIIYNPGVVYVEYDEKINQDKPLDKKSDMLGSLTNDEKSDIWESLTKDNTDDIILFSTSNSWENSLTEFNHISSIGNVLYTNLSILLIICSIILLLAMIGAIVITKKDKDSNSLNS